MREEFLAGLEDRRYLTIGEARAKRLQVRRPWCLRPACHAHMPSIGVPSSGPAGNETVRSWRCTVLNLCACRCTVRQQQATNARLCRVVMKCLTDTG